MTRPELWIPGGTITPAMWEARVTPIARTAVALIRVAGLRDQRLVIEDASTLLDFLPAHTAASRLQDGAMRPDWGTLKQVAEMLGISYTTLHRWASKGRGPGGTPIRAQQHGQAWFVSLDDAAAAAVSGTSENQISLR